MAMVDYVGDTSGGVVLELELESASSSPRCKNPKSWVCVTTADVESDSFDVEELTKTVKLKEALGSSSSSLSVTLSRLAVGLHRIGRIVEAKSICCRVVYFETTRAPAAASTSTQSSNLAMAFNNLGCVCFQLGQSMEAQTYLECALAVATDPQAGEENEPAFTAKIRRNLAIYYLNDGGEPQLASHLLGLVLRSKEEQLRETNLEVVDGCTELIDYLDLYAQSLLQCPAMESKKLGEQCYERSLQIAQAKFGQDSLELKERYVNLGLSAEQCSRPDDSTRWLRKAQKVLEESGENEFSPEMLRIDGLIARVSCGKHAGATAS